MTQAERPAGPLPAGVTSEMVELAYARFVDCCNTMIACRRCNGTGHHHGFGEHGHDPDWCENCGGCQFVPKYEDDKDSMREALTAALAGRVVVPGWQPIETAPKDGTSIILASTHSWSTECSWWSGERCAKIHGGHPDDYHEAWYKAEDEGDEFCQPTHWMPKIAPPAMLAAAVEGEE